MLSYICKSNMVIKKKITKKKYKIFYKIDLER